MHSSPNLLICTVNVSSVGNGMPVNTTPVSVGFQEKGENMIFVSFSVTFPSLSAAFPAQSWAHQFSLAFSIFALISLMWSLAFPKFSFDFHISKCSWVQIPAEAELYFKDFHKINLKWHFKNFWKLFSYRPQIYKLRKKEISKAHKQNTNWRITRIMCKILKSIAVYAV